jgi:hypothetical protein
MLEHELVNLIGNIPPETNPFRQRMRFHQGWWRAFVLAQSQGRNPAQPENAEEGVCNTITGGRESGVNFLTSNASKALLASLSARNKGSVGLINEDRVFNNLLSSQPLCFNFFAELACDTIFAAEVLKHWIPDLASVGDVQFEYGPPERYTNDNSAFDVAFFYTKLDGKKGILGLECKYTDDFSKQEYDKPEYREYFAGNATFTRPYEEYIRPEFNQLFRNQLLGEAMKRHEKVAEVVTGLFCHQLDERALKIAGGFQGMLAIGPAAFKMVTYSDFISVIQKMDLTIERREWSMMLWARYCSLQFSESIWNMMYVRS